MNYSEAERRLFALHYFLPVPLNRLTPIIELNPTLTAVHEMPLHVLAKALKLPHDKAVALRENLRTTLSTPFHTYYKHHNIVPIPYSHPTYPNSLFQLIDPPAVLYIKGNTSLLEEHPKVAIIGSRKATSYSEQVMELLVPPLVSHNAIIVSGLATGADTMAHKAALKFGGKTIAVLGHGHFHLYPKENRNLAKQMEESHSLLTEYPPYVKPAKWTFPMRNRIISGLSDAVVVTESAEKSGTMSTIEHALDHGKDIYAVPGPVTSPLSVGPNRLIVEGAKPVQHGFQIVQGSFISHA